MAMALLALVMLSFASVQSVVMRTILSPTEGMAADCSGRAGIGIAAPGSMSGMIMDGAHTQVGHGRRFQVAQDHKAACPYCEVVAHLPVIGHAVFAQRIGIVTFAAFQVIQARGPRGPPALELRARDPPPNIPTA